jgi:hypothetical protein
LWNIRCYGYCHKNERGSAFKNLMKELKHDGFQDITLEILPKKNKNIKTIHKRY